jgi:heme a synthase
MTALTAVGEQSKSAGRKGAQSSLAALRIWLFALAVLVVAMVAVGGATRLTGSGLSITEWRLGSRSSQNIGRVRNTNF